MNQCFNRAALLIVLLVVLLTLGLPAFAQSSSDAKAETLWQKIKHSALSSEKPSETSPETAPETEPKTEEIQSNSTHHPVTSNKDTPALTPAEEFRQTYLHKVAVIQTQRGEIAFKLFPDEAPKTVENFASLVKKGFYDVPSMKFHRVVPGFVVQTGDPTGTGYGGSGHPIQLEAKNPLSHNKKGIVAMARGPAPNSATSQFYITLKPQIKLDGKYAIFGEVIKGLDVLDLIQQDDRVYGIQFVDELQIKPDQPAKKKSLLHMF